MFLKSLLAMMAMVIALGAAVPASAGKAADLEAYHDTLDRYYNAVKAFDKSAKAEAAKLQSAAPAQAVQAPAPQYAAAPPPVQVVLVPRTYYYWNPNYGGYVVVRGYFPRSWGYRGWYAGSPSHGRPIARNVWTKWGNGGPRVHHVSVPKMGIQPQGMPPNGRMMGRR